jgi:hypothetical protein
MPGMKVLSAFLVMVPATILLTTGASLSEPAAEQCKASPNGAAPRGAHWYYHINRGTKQHCWYLGQAGGRIKSHTRLAEVADPVAAVRPADTADADDATATTTAAPPATAQAVPPQASVMQAVPPQASAMQAVPPQTATPQAVAGSAAGQPASDRSAGTEQFGARWPEGLPKVEDLMQSEPPAVSDSYAERRDLNATGQMPSKWPVADAAGASAGETALRYFLLVGIVAIPLLLLVGWLAKYARKPQRSDPDERLQPRADRSRQRRRIVADEAELAEPAARAPVVSRRAASDRNAQALTDPAQDLKASLSELMGDLRRAGGPDAPARRAAERSDGLVQDRLNKDRLNRDHLTIGEDANDRAFGPYLQAAE